MFIRQISIFVENSEGKLLPITSALENAGIDIRALSVSDTKDFGILRMIVSDCEKATEILKGIGCTIAITEVIGIGVPDCPGGLSGAVGVLAENGINIEYMYAFVGGGDKTAFVILRVENNQKAAEALRNGNVKLISESEILSL